MNLCLNQLTELQQRLANAESLLVRAEGAELPLNFKQLALDELRVAAHDIEAATPKHSKKTSTAVMPSRFLSMDERRGGFNHGLRAGAADTDEHGSEQILNRR